MITTSGLRNAFWCVIAFGIVACASAPLPIDAASPDSVRMEASP